MIKYFAFLRAINVGGKNLIKMEDLKKIFESLGFKNVRTYIQSGNIIFETTEKSKEKIIKRTEKELHKYLGEDVLVFLRTFPEVKAIVKYNPFSKIKTAPSTKLYVSFINQELKMKLKLPFVSAKKGVEVIAIKNCEVYCITAEVNGRFGFPNNFVEDYFDVAATSRNWNTINKIIT
ncbi:MAG: DUF1697 domain-containing protein [Ignavibacteriales bacterium]|nr:DUF1697 domain-containing protein [Ignavibacteriales bacterium]